jgi:NADH-quinone oxidoreductase subunit G
MGESIMLGTVSATAREISQLGKWEGARAPFTPVAAAKLPAISGDQALLTSWRRLLDMGTMQRGEDSLAGTRRQTVVVISAQRAAAISVVTGDQVRISNNHGSITLPVLVEDIHDDAVWIPRNSFGSQALTALNAVHGEIVTVVKA